MIVHLGLIDSKLPSNAVYLKSLISKTSRLEIVPYAEVINNYFEAYFINDIDTFDLTGNFKLQKYNHIFLLCNFTHSLLPLVLAILLLLLLLILISARKRNLHQNKSNKVQDVNEMRIQTH